MLKPFYIKKKNIDNRLIPAVTAADAGKVLGVTEDGKIAAVEGVGDGRFLPVFTVTNEEFAEVGTDFVLFLNGITDLTSKRFNFTGTTVKEKIKDLIDSGTFLCKLNVSIFGDLTALGWVGNSREICFPLLTYAISATGQHYRCTIIFGYNDHDTYVSVIAEPYAVVTS